MWPSTLVLRICVLCIPVFFTGPPKVRAVGDSANRGIGDADRVGERPSFFCPVSTFNFQLSTSDPPTPDPALPAIQPAQLPFNPQFRPFNAFYLTS